MTRISCLPSGEMAKNVLEKANELTKPDTIIASAAAGLDVNIANWLESLQLSCYAQQFQSMGYDNLATVHAFLIYYITMYR